MNKIWNDLYQAAKAVQNNRNISAHVSAGCVAAAIEAESGKIYTGVCIDTASTLGICAERNALFHMITCGENAVRRVLCVMPDGKTGSRAVHAAHSWRSLWRRTVHTRWCKFCWIMTKTVLLRSAN